MHTHLPHPMPVQEVPRTEATTEQAAWNKALPLAVKLGHHHLDALSTTHTAAWAHKKRRHTAGTERHTRTYTCGATHAGIHTPTCMEPRRQGKSYTTRQGISRPRGSCDTIQAAPPLSTIMLAQPTCAEGTAKSAYRHGMLVQPQSM